MKWSSLLPRLEWDFCRREGGLVWGFYLASYHASSHGLQAILHLGSHVLVLWLTWPERSLT